MKIIQLNFLSSILLCLLLCSISSSKVKLLQIINLPKETYTGRVMFYMQSATNKSPSYPINRLDYKLAQITNTELIIYRLGTDQTQQMQLSNYLMTIKLSQIDLPCNDYLYLCTLGEFKKEYSNKLYGIDFSTPEPIKQILHTNANSKCLVVTQGSFESLSQLAYLCFEVICSYLTFRT